MNSPEEGEPAILKWTLKKGHWGSENSCPGITLSIMDWMFVSPQNSYVETLTPNVMVLGSGVFRRWLGHEAGALGMGLVPS